MNFFYSKNKSLFFLKSIIIVAFFVFSYHDYLHADVEKDAPFLTELKTRGFSLLPAPQQVELGDKNVIVDGSWGVESSVGKDNIAYKRLIEGVSELHNLNFGLQGKKKIFLGVKSGTIKSTNDVELLKQGYLLQITAESIHITGNTEVGLFYGVQSLLQLIRRNPSGECIVPECAIRDWPATQLRFVHWDTKHHQKRIETLKRLIDWHAFFKVNTISFEMEDKYEYPSHPVIGAPGAYTKSEMQELTKYALERHIQLVPNIQAPAHMAYVLKHKEFAHLKSDGSNYQACMCDPEAIELIFDMYQDMIDATPGVDYFHVSTDEIYYAGICDKCDAPYNEENRSLAWVEFAVKAHGWLKERGRRMIAWVEYPLLPKHIAMLPGDIINGVGGNKAFTAEEEKIGMRQLAYSSTQGAELLFPNHFAVEKWKRQNSSRLEENSKTLSNILETGTTPMGTFAAAWDDAGLHEETFQLGWAVVSSYGWNPYFPTVEQGVADFMDIFYGQNAPDMISAYYLLIEGARFYEEGWDIVTSTERGPGYGNSYGKGIGTRRTDELLDVPEIPAAKTLDITPTFSEKYKELITKAESIKYKNDELINKLTLNIGQVERNRYNLEVFLSIAYLQRYFIKTILTLRDAESLLIRAKSSENEKKYDAAVSFMVEASNEVNSLNNWSKWMWKNLTHTWEKSRYEKGRSMGGRNFVHVLDDVKDHWADRRIGLDYMIAPFQRMKLPEWQKNLNERINEFAKEHNVPVSGLEEVRLED
ncbi:MAG: glycoside hydrolase family 20 zincin-like fold domain-containing protein [Fermentimonas sp.]